MPLAVRHSMPDLLGVKWRPEDMPEDEDRCVACAASFPRGASFCPHCGEVYGASKACCECGAEIPADAVFCGKCGARQPVTLRECRAISSNGHAGLASFIHAQVLEQQGDTSRAAVLLVRAFHKETHAP